MSLGRLRRGVAIAVTGCVALAIGAVLGDVMLTSASGSTTVASSTTGASTNLAPITYAPVGSGAGVPTYSSVSAAVNGLAASSEFTDTDIRSVSLTTPPSGSGATNNNWLDIVVGGSSTGWETSLGDWEAAMLFAELRDSLHDSSLQTIDGYTLQVQLPDGTVQTLGGLGAGNVAFNQTFVSEPQSEMTAALTQEAEAAGLQVDSITYLSAADTVPIIKVTSPQPQTFLNQHPDPSLVFSDSGPYEGIYVELLDPSGAPVLVSDAAFRDGEGDITVAPGYTTAAVAGGQSG